MSSIEFVQVGWGQFGVGDLCILWRCLLRGTWPVLSWVSILVCLRLSELDSFMNLSKGSDGSMVFILSNLGDFVHQVLISFLVLSSMPFLMAVMLIGSW